MEGDVGALAWGPGPQLCYLYPRGPGSWLFLSQTETLESVITILCNSLLALDLVCLLVFQLLANRALYHFTEHAVPQGQQSSSQRARP